MTVALYGLNHKNAKNDALWVAAFVFATLYQARSHSLPWSLHLS